MLKEFSKRVKSNQSLYAALESASSRSYYVDDYDQLEEEWPKEEVIIDFEGADEVDTYSLQEEEEKVYPINQNRGIFFDPDAESVNDSAEPARQPSLPEGDQGKKTSLKSAINKTDTTDQRSGTLPKGMHRAYVNRKDIRIMRVVAHDTTEVPDHPPNIKPFRRVVRNLHIIQEKVSDVSFVERERVLKAPLPERMSIIVDFYYVSKKTKTSEEGVKPPSEENPIEEDIPLSFSLENRYEDVPVYRWISNPEFITTEEKVSIRSWKQSVKLVTTSRVSDLPVDLQNSALVIKTQELCRRGKYKDETNDFDDLVKNENVRVNIGLTNEEIEKASELPVFEEFCKGVREAKKPVI